MARRGRPKGRSLAKIQEEIEKKFNKAVRELAENVAEQIEIEYGRVISGFYNDRVFPYNTDPSRPLRYSRTFSLYEASNANDGINSPGVIESIGDGYLSGIEVTANNISGNPYRANKGWVFGRAYYYGIHGFNKKTITKIKMRRKKQGLGYNIDYFGELHPNTLSNIPLTSYYDVPGMHYHKPVQEMEWGFKRITKQSNMDKMWQQVLRNNGL